MLDARRVTVTHERSSRKQPLRDREVRDLLRSVRRVIVAKGKKVTELDAARTQPADLKGPTGNYRAPMVRKGTTLLVGFNREALEELV